MRNIDDLCPENTDQAENFLPLCSRFGVDGNQRHVALNVRTAGHVQHLANPCQPFALFDDLFDGAIVAARHDGDARPLRIKRRTDRNRFNVEPARTEQPDNAGKFARLICDHD